MSLAVLYLIYVLGVVVSIALPYLIEYVNQPEPFVWRKVVGQLIVGLIGIIPILGVPEFASHLLELAEMWPPLVTFFAVLTMAWGASTMGRTGQKAYDLLKKPAS